MVERIEPALVDLEPLKRPVGRPGVDRADAVHRREVAHAAEEPARDARRAAGAARNLVGAVGRHLDAEEPRPPPHDEFEFGNLVEMEADRNAEAVAQRCREKPRARRRADESERRKIDPHRPRPRPLADDEIELEILHCRIEDLLDRRRQPVDLVDEEHVAWFEIGEERREIARLGNHGA